MTIWIVYVVVAATASLLFVVAGLRTRRVATMPIRQHADNGSGRYVEAAIDQDNPVGDVQHSVTIALKRLASVIHDQAVHIDVGLRAGLMARVRAPLLADMMEEMLAIAIHAAPGGRLLLTAALRGDRIYVNLTNDMPNADWATMQSRVRGLAERVALRGESLDLTVRPHEGTTMTLRLAAEPSVESEAPEFETDDSDGFAMSKRVAVTVAPAGTRPFSSGTRH